MNIQEQLQLSRFIYHNANRNRLRRGISEPLHFTAIVRLCVGAAFGLGGLASIITLIGALGS